MRSSITVVVAMSVVAGLVLVARGQLDLQERLDSLDARLLKVTAQQQEKRAPQIVYRDVAGPGETEASATSSTSLEAGEADEAVQPEHVAEPTDAVALLEGFTDRGYMYARDWEQMEPRLAKMSKAEQKLFWDGMFRAIESGSLETYDD